MRPITQFLTERFLAMKQEVWILEYNTLYLLILYSLRKTRVGGFLGLTLFAIAHDDVSNKSGLTAPLTLLRGSFMILKRR
jgi:hypothetical protein